MSPTGKSEFVTPDTVDLSCDYADVGCSFQGQTVNEKQAHETGLQQGVRHLAMVKDRTGELDHKISQLNSEMTSIINDVRNLKMVTNSDESLSQLKKLIRTFPLCNLKNSQYLHATQLKVAELKEELDREKVLREKQQEEMSQLREDIEHMKLGSNSGVSSNGIEQPHFGSHHVNSTSQTVSVGINQTGNEKSEPMDLDAVDGTGLHKRADSGYSSYQLALLASPQTVFLPILPTFLNRKWQSCWIG